MIKHVSVIISALVASGAAASEKVVADTARVLDELVVIESAAKAPVPLLPLDVRIVGSDVIEKSTETNILPVLQNHIPGMFVTERGSPATV